MYRRLYHRLYHRPSGPVRPASDALVAVSPLGMPVSGVPGARSLRFATPGPWPVPCLSAPSSRGTDARRRSLQARGQGCAPAPRLAALARRWRVVKPALFRLAIPSPRAIQGGVRGGVFGAVHEDRLYSVPLASMFGRKKSAGRESPADERLENLPVVAEIVRDDWKVVAREFRIPCGHAGYWLEALWYDASNERWFQLGLFREVGLQTVIDLMQEALNGLNPGWRQLPAVGIGAKWYVVDERLMQLRNINNPHDAIEIPKV